MVATKQGTVLKNCTAFIQNLAGFFVARNNYIVKCAYLEYDHAICGRKII